jgi:hypothetical protein
VEYRQIFHLPFTIGTHSENDLPIRKCGLNILKIPPIVYYWKICGWSLRMRSLLLLLLSILFYSIAAFLLLPSG